LDEPLSIVDFMPGYFDSFLAAIELKVPYFAVDLNLDRYGILSADHNKALVDLAFRNCTPNHIDRWLKFTIQAVDEAKNQEEKAEKQDEKDGKAEEEQQYSAEEEQVQSDFEYSAFEEDEPKTPTPEKPPKKRKIEQSPPTEVSSSSKEKQSSSKGRKK
jgi:hypothetical protein